MVNFTAKKVETEATFVFRISSFTVFKLLSYL